MQTVDSQGNILLLPGRSHPLDAHLLGKENSLLWSKDISLAPPTKKEQRKQEKLEKQAKQEKKKQEKLEIKLQHIEAKMIAKLPTHMVIYTIPLIATRDPLLLTSNQVPPGRFRAKITRKLQEQMVALTPMTTHTVKGRAVRWANRNFEAVSSDTRLLSNTPSTISHLTLVHPESIPSDKMFDNLTTQTYLNKKKHKKRLILCSIALPIIAAAEGLAPVWPNIITVVDAAFVIFHYNAYRGAKRLLRFEVNQKDQITCEPTPCIDRWISILAEQRDGVLNEEQITNMCYELGTPEMIQMLNELRRDYLRKINRHDLLSPLQR